MRALLLLALLVLPLPVAAQTQPFGEWLQGVEQEAVASGISPATARQALASVTPDERVVVLDRKQPESSVTFATYSKNILSPARVRKGRALLAQHGELLLTVGARYGVPPSMIVALWGIESGFGRNTGGFDVIPSLATLAYEGRRADFFRGELLAALRIVDTDRIDFVTLRGSWAGAMGQCQFMPSTYLRYAVDYDGDGRRDIWENEGDVFASIANYLAAEGWRSGMTWGREVRLRHAVAPEVIGIERQHSLTEWSRMGVRTLGGKTLPKKALSASLIQPDGAGGRSFLVYDNFRALMRWNRSTYFATSAGLLADRLHLSR